MEVTTRFEFFMEEARCTHLISDLSQIEIFPEKVKKENATRHGKGCASYILRI